jgi:hypothetical protein
MYTFKVKLFKGLSLFADRRPCRAIASATTDSDQQKNIPERRA